MEQYNKDKQPEGLNFLLAAICGILTGWVITQSLLWVFAGAVLGLLIAGFYLNVLVKGRHD